ncbi:MAG: ABC transporter permease [Gemmatimonadetes bacterium]|nr:ABC transporter permease [Gemmatimonadota bacterium]
MRAVIALLRANALAAASYRLQTLLSLLSLTWLVVPLFFIAGALQPFMAPSIKGQGGQYFAFVLTGMITYQAVGAAVGAVPSAIRNGIGSGALEAMLGTPSSLPLLLAGMTAYDFVWSLVRATSLLLTGALLGAPFVWGRAPLGLLIVLLTVAAHLPFGLLAAAFVLAFRTTTPLPNAVLTASILFGGVYYPTRVLPAWLPSVAEWLPMTYGLRALRQAVLERAPLHLVLPDMAILLLFAVGLLAGSGLAFAWSLRYARRAGTLSQY